ncbi:hypothetical protein E2C01_072639 [Portunus trituberculatus]|uniref:Uncharacterized protein n=1 Tax=Portunus trituberculatus TaxID=210409 RepID=A0A5B7I9H1_PORTR|nr:hypothetical protein [Portunus trituberculatus]
MNQTATGFTVACQEGFDGGLRQVFMLRVARPGTQGRNLTAGTPVFQVRGGDTGRRMKEGREKGGWVGRRAEKERRYAGVMKEGTQGNREVIMLR